MRQEMSFVSLILFVAIGILVFAILFLFAKRQIARFTLKAARTPHANIGNDAPGHLKQEIERRLKHSQNVRGEPLLMSPKYEAAFLEGPNKENMYLYRMKAIDSFRRFDTAIRSVNAPSRKAYQPVRQYLLALTQGPLHCSTDLIHEFADLYDHARHDPALFREEDFLNYNRLLNQLITATRTKPVSRQNSTASSDSATSQTALISDDVTAVTYRHNARQTPSLSRDQISNMSIVPEESSV